MNNQFEIFFIPLDEKLVNGRKPNQIIKEGSCFQNEIYSFQLVYKNNMEELFPSYPSIEIISSIKEHIKIRQIEEMPCTLPFRKGHDDNYLIYEPSLVGDLIKEEDSPIVFRYGVYRSISLTYDGEAKPGEYEIEVILRFGDGREANRSTFRLIVLPIKLPKLGIHASNWMHYDGLSQYYNVPMFSKEYMDIYHNFLDEAIRHGIDCLLVPMFSPALDTYEGGERLCSQLLEIENNGDVYSFSFSRLINFMKDAKSRGIRLFEMSHLFTQWGALHAPNIVDIHGNHLFGWKTDSLDPKYLSFLNSSLSKLTSILKQEGFSEDEVYFHLSDEPNVNHKDRYARLKEAIYPSLNGYKTIDAISNVSISEMIDLPVVSIEKIEDFIKEGKNDIFVYHCCSEETNNLPNRFLSMPLDRLRVIGTQLYYFNVKGYLHWGYNFYNSGFSKTPINPFLVNDAEGNFPSGDSFIVYPGENGKPLSSLRLEMLQTAFFDYRALVLLEKYIGREKVILFLNKCGFGPNFSTYPTKVGSLLEIRKTVEKALLVPNPTDVLGI